MNEDPITRQARNIREARRLIKAVENRDGTAIAWSNAAMALEFARTHFADVLTAASATNDPAVKDELRMLAIGLGEDPDSDWWVDE